MPVCTVSCYKDTVINSIRLIVQGIQDRLSYRAWLDKSSYRRCPYCGKQSLHRHGHYLRKTGRNPHAQDRYELTAIQRYFCPGCQTTCSALPAYLAPRDWYSWAVQEQVLRQYTAANSYHRISRRVHLCRRTVRRWVARFQAQFVFYASALRQHIPALGRTATLQGFWQACLAQMPLSQAMSIAYRTL